MLKLSYDQINRTKQNSPVIAWYNLTLASSIKNLELVNAAAYAWFTENPTNNITDLEDRLRKENIDVYLVAKPALELELDGKIVNLQHLNNKTGDKLIYELDFAPNYQWSKCKKCFNIKTGRQIKQVYNSGSVGYNIKGKFKSLYYLRSHLRPIQKRTSPF